MVDRTTTEQKELMFALRAEGKSYRKIQQITGLSKSTLSYHFGKGQKEKNIKRGRTYRANLKNFVDRYKEERGCQDCRDEGYPGKHPYYVLDADHVRGEKTQNISQMYRTNTIQETLDELEKCDIVCANHHRIRTHRRRIIRREIEAGKK
jgi:predicted transcriptional regulator